MPLPHPWHELSPGDQTPQIVRAVIEIPTGSKAKYEIDKETGYIKLDRILYSSVHYPANYGFVPQSYCGDGDPLDILVLCQEALVPGCWVAARVLGVMRMLDSGEADDKLIAVADRDASLEHLHDAADLPPHTLSELRNFFEIYKSLENKTIRIEPFLGREAAYEIIQQSFIDYRTKFGKR